MSFDVDVTVRRGDAIIGTSFRTEQGSAVLFGPSGVGKTSVLAMIAGLLRPDRGHVRVNGRPLFDAVSGLDLPPQKRRVGMVFQDPRLFPHLSVRRNLLYGARDGSMLTQVVRKLDIEPLLDRWPRTLSGGEARRVAIGRALLSDPAFLLLDEPLASLDQTRREDAMQVIERIRDDLKLPMLIVTHDRHEAERLGQHIIQM